MVNELQGVGYSSHFIALNDQLDQMPFKARWVYEKFPFQYGPGRRSLQLNVC